MFVTWLFVNVIYLFTTVYLRNQFIYYSVYVSLYELNVSCVSTDLVQDTDNEFVHNINCMIISLFKNKYI